MEDAPTASLKRCNANAADDANSGNQASKRVRHQGEAQDSENKQEEPHETIAEASPVEASATALLEANQVGGNNGDDKGRRKEGHVEQGGPSVLIGEDNHSRHAEAEIDDDKEHAKEEEGDQVVAPVPDEKENSTALQTKVGPKLFTSSVDMFNYFYDLVHGWPLNFNLNKYEQMMLEDLIAKGHNEPGKKIGVGIQAFQVRINPEYYSRCYYIIRKDGSVDDFSYRKCVDNIMALPEDMKPGSVDTKLGHRGGRGRGGGFRGRGNRGHGRSRGRGRF